MKAGKMTFDVNTRKLSKTLELISDHMKSLSDQLKEMDLKGCPECGSFKYRDEHIVNDNLKEVKCLECGHVYVIQDGVVDLLHRK